MTLFQLSDEMALIESILEENGGELTPELESAWEETRESLVRKTDNYGVLLQKLKASEDAISNEIKRLQKLKKTTANTQERVKGHILNCMNVFGIDKLEGYLTKISKRKSKSLNVDEGLLMAAYKDKIDALNKELPPYMTIKIEVNKTEIKNSFKEIDILPQGCEYQENESLNIR